MRWYEQGQKPVGTGGHGVRPSWPSNMLVPCLLIQKRPFPGGFRVESGLVLRCHCGRVLYRI